MTDVEKILKAILGPQVPAVVLLPVLVLLLWKALKEPILDFVAVLRWVWRIPTVGLKQSREDVARAKRRAAFAREMRGRVLDLGEEQGFDDARFADVDLTVAVGDLTSRWWRRGFSGGRRRERSLARVLDHSDKQILRLQGDPGSGKSVALRHLTAVMADRAARKPRLGWRIPVYLDLSRLRLDAEAGTPVEPAHIEAFVSEQLGARHLGSATDTLKHVWEEGIEDGAWIFLFDSFDEIPAVLTATEDDDPMVREYWTAITGYIDAQHECRGVVASRGFRTPTSSRWPVLDIQRLSSRRQADLVRNSGLDADAQQTVLDELPKATKDIQAMAATPLFLALLCDHVERSGTLPTSVSGAYEAYVQRRLERDSDRVRRSHGVDVAALWTTAERIGYAMSAVDGLGLKPRRSALMAGLSSLDCPVTADTTAAMDALVSIGLASSDDKASPSDPTFGFAGHRRIQEYFATRLVQREPHRVAPGPLLTDQKWRETVVALFQTDSEVTGTLLEQANERLDDMLAEMETSEGRFRWPTGAEHLLGILQAGFAQRREPLPEDVTRRTDRLLRAAADGSLPDRRWALGVVGAASPATAQELLGSAFATRWEWLKDAAYQQVALLRDLPPEIARSIRLTLMTMLGDGRLSEDAGTVRAQIRQLDRPDLMRRLQAHALPADGRCPAARRGAGARRGPGAPR